MDLATGQAQVSVSNSNGLIDGLIVAGQNSRMALGRNDGGTWLNEVMTDISRNRGAEYTTVFGVYNPHRLTGGPKSGLVVDGSITDNVGSYSANTITFADDSLFVTNLGHSKADSQALLSADSGLTLNIGSSTAGNAAIYLANAQVGTFRDRKSVV